MHIPIPGVDPVAIALDRIDTSGDIRFSGVDIETGARVTIMIQTAANDQIANDGPTQDASGLVLVLSIDALRPRQ